MIQILAGEKGEGKTKRLIEMANADVKNTHGHIVYIDNDRRHIFDLHYDIRFVETSDFPLSNYRELIGFIYGILSQDNDIEKIYIDGIYNIVKTISYEDWIKLSAKLKTLKENQGISFVICANILQNELPVEIKEYLI